MTEKNFDKGAAAPMSAIATNANTQWTKYHGPKGGHGFAAEDANSMAERLKGNKTVVVGTDNAKNGADILIDGVPHQVKHCRTAARSIDACFYANGNYRYPDMKIMVPKDQYAEAVELMKQKIAAGKIPGKVNPDDAKSIIKKGNITYKQSQRIRHAGTKESLAFDAVTQAQVAGMVGGLAAGMSFISALLQGKSVREAWREARKSFVKAGLVTWVGGIATQQFLRTASGRTVAAFTTTVAKSAIDASTKTIIGNKAVEKIAQGVSGKALRGIAARNVVTKTVRVNAITSAVMFVADSVPDMVKLSRGKMSGKDFCKSRAVGATGVVGGSAGYLAGMAIGTAICPGVGTTIGGLIGGIGGGMGASSLMNKLVSYF